jgi:acetyltransferase-like isoleucine patch superfamily enzyme
MISILYKAIRKIHNIIKGFFYTPINKLYLALNGVKVPKGLKTSGLIKVIVTRRGKVLLGENLSINSGKNHNIIGRQQKTTFWVEGNLIIGNYVGMSSTAIICNHEIEIGNYVTIGGNTVIYDTDFHTLDPIVRKDKKKDKINAKWGKVTIKDNVFIGEHSTILKGVTIGRNSIVGACSVVTKNIPDNEIWAGNPARFIKNINKV